jgi:hypothetical protein
MKKVLKRAGVSSLISTGRPNSTRIALYRTLQRMTYLVVAAVAIGPGGSSLVSTGRPNFTRIALYRPLQKMTYSVVVAVATLKVKRERAGLAVSSQPSTHFRF